jgi:hypothetical protein
MPMFFTVSIGLREVISSRVDISQESIELQIVAFEKWKLRPPNRMFLECCAQDALQSVMLPQNRGMQVRETTSRSS